MKNLLTLWELKRKTDSKLDFSRLVLLGFLYRAIGGWLAALLFSSARPSRQSSNHQGSEPSGIEPLWVGISGVRAIRDWAIRGRPIRDQAIGVQAIVGATSIRGKVALEEGKTTDWSVKNLLTQWELRRKTKVEKIL